MRKLVQNGITSRRIKQALAPAGPGREEVRERKADEQAAAIVPAIAICRLVTNGSGLLEHCRVVVEGEGRRVAAVLGPGRRS